MTSYKLLLKLIVFVLAWFMFNCYMSFDCRRNGQNCMGGGICEGGVCNCTGTGRKGFNCGIVTANENPDQSLCGCENSGACMNDSSCICTEKHYGNKCQYQRDEILCFGDRKVIFLFPFGFTSGKIFINDKRDVPECQFKKVKDITETNDFSAGWTEDGLNGYALTINDTDNTCGNITVTEDGKEITYTRLINIEFDDVIITSLDEIVSASCSFSNDSMRSIPGTLVTTNLTSQVYNQSETINKYEPLVYSAKQGDSDIGQTPLLVGSEITFTFNIPPETGYESVIIETFQATATDVALDLITAKCVNSSASSIIQSLSRADARTVELVVKVFKFVTSNDITFTGIARICRAGETDCDEDTSCQPKSFKGLGRRKRESGDSLTVVEKIRVTTDSNLAKTSSEQTGNSVNNQGTCQDSSAKEAEEFHCLQKSEIIIVLALMAATIVILLIVCVILTWRLLRTSPKVAEVQPSEYDTTHSLPRLVPTHF